MKFLTMVAVSIVVSACARVQKTETTVKESDFGVPENLAAKFAISEEKNAAPLPAEKTVPEAIPVKNKKETKPAKVAKAAKAAAAPVTIPANKGTWPNRWNGPQPFHPGERHAFDVTYFGTTAGSVELTVKPYKFIGDREVFHFQGYATSTSIFALFYRLNDLIESFMDKSALFSHKLAIKLDESAQQRDIIELYDQKKKKLYYWSRLDHKSKGKSNDRFEADIKEYTQDVLSSVFFLRTLPLEVGKNFHFPVVSNGKPWDVEANVVRREEISTKAGCFNAFVIKPITKFEGVLKTTGDSFIWISDDEHRAVLKIEAKVKIGTVIAYLRELEYGKP